MDLERQLCLDNHGGVKFLGNRLEPTQDPVLFVGLGGTGIDALLRIKNEVQTRMPLPKDANGKIIGTSPKNIGFLAFDWDRQAMNKTYGIAGFNANREEFINIGVDGFSRAIDSIREQTDEKDPVWSWLDRDITGTGDGSVASIRQIGRFMLTWNIEYISSRIQNTINNVLAAVRGKSKTSVLRIFLLTGIGGCTGSGTFIDIAYLLREFGKVNNITQMFGYIFTPDLNKVNGGDWESMYRNGFASLKELDYWMSIDEHGEPFVQQYSDAVKVDSLYRPFDYCHLITGRDLNSQVVTYNEAMDSVARELFSFIVNEQDGNSALQEMYDYVKGHIESAAKKAPANYNYVSIGSDKLEIPYTQITTLVAGRLIRKLQPMIDRCPGNDEFMLEMYHLGLMKDQLRNYMQQNMEPYPSSGRQYKYADIWPSNDPYTRDWNWLQQHATIKTRENGSNLAGVYERRLLDYLQSVMKDANRGPCYAARLIYSTDSYSLIPTLEGYRTDCQERMETANRQIVALKQKLSECFAAGQNAGVFGKGSVTKEYTELLDQWIRLSTAFWVESNLCDGLAVLIERLQKYYDKIFAVLLENLVKLSDISDRNLEKLALDEEDFTEHPEKAKRYLIRPLQYEKEFAERLNESMTVAVTIFGRSVLDDLKKWTGLSLNEVDSEQPTDADVEGALAEFIFKNFEQELSLNMETLLMKDAGGRDMDSYFREKLDDLRQGAVPLYELAVEQKNRVNLDEFSMISVPNDCANLLRVAGQSAKRGETVKKSEELSRLQWVKVIAGIPIFALPSVTEMEELYEKAMQGNPAARRGVHLRYDWRDHMPSPIPEITWATAVAARPFKEYVKARNKRVREAFDKCRAEGILRLDGSESFAVLVLTNETAMDALDLSAFRFSEKNKMAEDMKDILWSEKAPSIALYPYAPGYNTEDTWQKIRENVLRFPQKAAVIVYEAETVDRYDALLL